MSEVFVYAYKGKPEVLCGSVALGLQKFKNHWFSAVINEPNFEVLIEGQTKKYLLPHTGKFAVYKEELLEIQNFNRKILFVSDLDGTLLVSNEEGKEAYERFVKFWITHLNFNGSILVYNTGRSFPFYQEAIHLLYEPDMLFVGLGSKAYRFDENGEGVLEESYEDSLKSSKDSFNTEVLSRQLYENFEFLNGKLKALTEYNIFFIVPDEIINAHSKSIKKFVNNKENESREGLIIKGKCVASKHYLIDEQFLEITPNFTGKNVGLKYAQKVFGFEDRDTFTAGDSENDIDLFKCPVAGVLVGNGEARISNWLHKKPRPLVYQSQLYYANAVIEGLEKFIFSINS